MDLNKYQEKIAEFYLFSRQSDVHSDYAVFNLVGEVGELFSLVAKAYRDGPKDDHSDNVVKELGDILFMVTCLVDALGFNLNEIAEKNIEKLEGRAKRGTISGSGDNR